MKISVIIPNYNSSKTILKTIKSIISQSYTINEIIVVDDASTDNSVELIKQVYQTVKIVKNSRNFGAGYSRNIGIKEARNELLLFVDSDVSLTKNLIKTLVKNNSEKCIIYPKIVYENKMTMYPNSKRDEKYLLISPIFMITKNALTELNGSYFDENYKGYCEDTDFFLKCYLFGLSSKYISNALAIHTVDKPKNREDRYYSEVYSTIYGFIKYAGYKELNKFDHAFKISNIFKLYILGLFNFKLFDAQLKSFNKGGNAFYKFNYLLHNKEKITDKGRVFLIMLTIKGIVLSLKDYKKALNARRDLKFLLKQKYLLQTEVNT